MSNIHRTHAFEQKRYSSSEVEKTLIFLKEMSADDRREDAYVKQPLRQVLDKLEQ